MSRNNIQALKTVDGETLMSKPLQPLGFVVDTLLSQGLHILAGSPKVGKSWLALWLYCVEKNDKLIVVQDNIISTQDKLRRTTWTAASFSISTTSV